ncbi:MAG: hypothetical protein K8R67_10500 [Desulfobacteraceae bacterium]|nr:hypothetical protein [Desulfobacteraceae bacterium]
MKGKNDNYFLVLIILFLFSFLFVQTGCDGGNSGQNEKATEIHTYTSQSGGNQESQMESEKLSDYIAVTIIDYTVIINNREFNDVDESLDYIYNLKKANNVPVIIDIKDSKAKTYVQFRDGLDQRGIYYDEGES